MVDSARIRAEERLRSAIAAAIRAIGVDALKCKAATEAVLDAIEHAGGEERTQLTVAEQRAALDALTRRHGCHAVSILARRVAVDPSDPCEIHRLERKFRRWRPRVRKNGHLSASEKTEP